MLDSFCNQSIIVTVHCLFFKLWKINTKWSIDHFNTTIIQLLIKLTIKAYFIFNIATIRKKHLLSTYYFSTTDIVYNPFYYPLCHHQEENKPSVSSNFTHCRVRSVYFMCALYEKWYARTALALINLSLAVKHRKQPRQLQ